MPLHFTRTALPNKRSESPTESCPVHVHDLELRQAAMNLIDHAHDYGGDRRLSFALATDGRIDVFIN